MVGETKALLASADPEERRRGVDSLAELDTREAVSVLPLALGDSDWRVRKEAVAVATRMRADAQLVQAVAHLLGPSENVGLRNAAVEVLANWGAHAIEALTAEAGKLDEDGRKLVAEALGKTGHSGALPVLRSMLSDPDTNVRLAALEGIAALGVVFPDDASAALRSRLEQGDTLEKLTALDGINHLGMAVQFERIEGLLQDRVLRQAAWLAAGRCREPRVAPRLVAALDGAQGSAWRWALAAVASYVQGSPELALAAKPALSAMHHESLARLLDAARSSDFVDERRRAIIVLGALGSSDAVRVVFEGTQDEAVADAAEQAFEMFGPEACDPLLEMYPRLSEPEQADALRLCGRVLKSGELPAGALGAVLDALSSTEEELVLGALDCLHTASDERCVVPTAQWLDKTDMALIRKAAGSALELMVGRHFGAARELARRATADGPCSLSAVTIIGAALTPVFDSRGEDVRFLADAVSHSAPSVRRAALGALAHAADGRAVNAVSFALADEVVEVRIAAARALGRLHDEHGRPVGLDALLEVIAATKDEAVMVASIRALGDTAAPGILDRLRPLVLSPAPLVAVAALEAVAELPDESRDEALMDGLAHPHVEVVKAALKTLAGSVSERVAERVTACLEHKAWDVRRSAADWLGRLGGEASANHIRLRLALEHEPLVREAMQRALVGGEAVRVVHRQTPVPGTGSWPPR